MEIMQSTLLPKRWVYLWDLLHELVARDIKLRYRRSSIGVAWSLLNPILQLVVFNFVFQSLLPLNLPNYTLFLFSGLLVWNWLQASLLGTTTSIVDSGNLIKRPGFPAAILPVAVISANFIHFLLALPILLIFLPITGVPITPVLWLLPIIIILQFLLTLSIAYFLATFHVSFRDTQHLVAVLLLLFFYLTPIFYDTQVIPPSFQLLYQLNPMVHLMNAYRAILLKGELPDFRPLAGVAVVSVAFLALGYRLFMRASYRFVEEM
jgi:lipopolysaccharide transport system permease protein